MEESVVALAGPKGRHNPDRTAVRHGHEQGSVTLGGRRVAVQRPRVRAADGSGELPVAAYELFSGTELLGRLALERMLGGLSTRRYGLAGAGRHQVEQTASGTSKSAVSRRFVAMTQTALAELLAADLSGLDLVCLMIDGVGFGEHTCVVALGIAIDGTKHPLALVEGSTGESGNEKSNPAPRAWEATSDRSGRAETTARRATRTDRCCPWMTVVDRCLGHVGGSAGEDELGAGVAAMGSSSTGGRGPSSVTACLVGKCPSGARRPDERPLDAGPFSPIGPAQAAGRSP
jgi:hypothetical protein